MGSDTRLYNEKLFVARQMKIVSRVEAGSNTSTIALRVVGGDGKGSLEYETVKYGHSDQKMTTLARVTSKRKRQTRPLIREKLHTNKPATV
jgi:hypothetical protein